MTRKMARIQVIGMKPDLRTAMRSLWQLGVVHIEDAGDTSDITVRELSLDSDLEERLEMLRNSLSQIEGISKQLDLKAAALEVDVSLTEDEFGRIRAGLDELRPNVQRLTDRLETLQSEADTLQQYETTMRKLISVVPRTAQQPDNVMIGALANRSYLDVLTEVRDRALELTDGKADIVSTNVDETMRAMLIIVPADYADDIAQMLQEQDVSRLRLPKEYAHRRPDAIVAAMQQRQSLIASELEQASAQLGELTEQWSDRLLAWRGRLANELKEFDPIRLLGGTDHTFVLLGWLPRVDLELVRSRLEAECEGPIAVLEAPIEPGRQAEAPVVLENPAAARPFESLVELLSLPRYGTLDPTRLMALFMPLFFGLILGDIGYGLVLLGLSLAVQRRLAPGRLHDLLSVIAIGSGWSIFFGAMFGEAFGSLGEKLGLHPIWFERSSAEFMPLLLALSVLVGTLHMALGLSLGIWQAIRERSRGHLLERGGMLIGLIALFLIAAVLAKLLPQALMTPAIAAMIVGLVLLAIPLGWLGPLLAPIEFVGLIGNVLSYLRIAAVGLASVYLARVANDVAGVVGSVVVGVIIAALIHALNLALGAFSPTIHSLRLHYVEFFRKFYEGGGQPYRPYGKQRLKP